MKRHLIFYPNASKGGVASVIRGRATSAPSDCFDFIAIHDRGGARAFDDLSNVRTAVVGKGREINYIEHLRSIASYDTISVLSAPKVANGVSRDRSATVSYEVHSSDLNVVESEFRELDFSRIDRVITPSEFMRDRISHLASFDRTVPISVVPNVVDRTCFYVSRAKIRWQFDGLVPLLWVGRFDRGKGFRQMLRALREVDGAVGIFVVSLEDDPGRAAEFFGEAAAQGVRSRVRVFRNLTQAQMADLYNACRQAGGCLVSTSLLESFGYSVAEALSCELPVVAFDLEVFHEHADPGGLMNFVDLGSNEHLVENLQGFVKKRD